MRDMSDKVKEAVRNFVDKPSIFGEKKLGQNREGNEDMLFLFSCLLARYLIGKKNLDLVY